MKVAKGMKRIRLGTRGSKLALAQAEMVAAALAGAHPAADVEIVTIQTSGEWAPGQGEVRLSEAQGGKGLFAREIEQALLAGDIDCGVHSMKDMDSALPAGLAIDHMLPRADPRDAFLANDYENLAALPAGARVGTASLRRQAFVLSRRPDLKVVPFRGNVPTRIDKLRSGQVEATILALAGLKRLGLEHEAASVLEPADMLPSAGQGAIGIETRINDKPVRDLLSRLHCRETGFRVKAERAALAVLDGSCRTPVGAYAVFNGDTLHLAVTVCSPDGRQIYEESSSAVVSGDGKAQALGQAVGETLRQRVDPAILA